ncbi:MAG: acyltransferase, partial [Verrucomicrobia bacterium]|nr:acyltransferase [Verrucomicrobiota bacterium]
MPKKNAAGLPVALIQMAMSPDPKKNLPAAIDRIRAAAKQGAKLICLPELFRSLYFCQREDYQCFELAEPIPGPTTELLAKTAKQLRITLVSSHFEQRTGGLYHNTAVVFGPDGSILGTYRKMHIPDDPGFSEKFYFA